MITVNVPADLFGPWTGSPPSSSPGTVRGRPAQHGAMEQCVGQDAGGVLDGLRGLRGEKREQRALIKSEQDRQGAAGDGQADPGMEFAGEARSFLLHISQGSGRGRLPPRFEQELQYREVAFAVNSCRGDRDPAIRSAACSARLPAESPS